SFDDLPAYTRVFGTYASDASSEVILHLDEDPSSGPTNHTPIGFAVFDHSLKGNNGYRNAMNFGPGRFGSAVSPNDTNLVVKIEDDAMLHSSAFTIEGWFNFDSNTGNKVLLAKTVGSGTNNSYIIYYTNGGLFAAIGNAAAMGPILGAPFTPTVGKWYHIAYSFDDNTNVHSLYVNGLLAASGANVVPIGYDNHPVVIGGEHENEVLSNFFDGKVDEVRVSSSLRNPSEFNLQLPPANITATAADTVVSLAWSAGGGTVPASRYRIYRGADSTSMTLVDSSYTTGFTETLPNGPAVYYYRAVTVDSTGFESMKSFAAADTVFDVLPPAAPVNIAALAQDSQVQVTWSPTAATDFKKYYIYGGTVPNPSSLIDSTSVIDDTVKIYSGLTNYTPYYYRVTVADTNGNISGFSGDASGMPFDQTPPAALTSLTAVPHDGSIDLSWSVSGAPDFMKYYVYGGPTPNPITRIDSLFLSNLNSTTISGLTNYTNYYFRVTAMDLNGNESNYSNEVSETPVDLTPPAAPQNLTAVVHDGQLDLHWNPNAEGDFGKYYVFFDINPNPTNRLDSTSADVNDTVRTLYGLTNYQPYHIRIAAVDQHGNVGPYSSEITATTVDQTPPAFVQYPVAVSGNHQVVLHWNPNSESDFSKYYIYTGLTSSPTTLIDSAIAGVNDTSKTITGLMNGTQYYFRLRTVDTSGNISAYSIDVFATPADVTPPSAPQNLTASAGDAQTTIHWNPNGESDFAKYYIYRGTSPNPTTAFDSTSIITDTLKTYSGLTNYQHYYFRIAAADSTGNISGYSNEVQTTPYDLTALLAPQSVAAVAGDGQVTLHWDENVEGDFKRYVIFAGTTPNPVTRYDSTTIILDTLKIYTGLTNYQTYYFRIVSEDTSGNISPFSNEVSVMPVDLTPPAAPHQLAAVAGDGQVTIHWNPNSETDFKKYYIYQGTSPNPTMLFDSGSTVIDTIKTYEGMTNNQTVYFRIAARDTSGNVGPYSNEVAVTPYDQTVPADPSALIARIGNGQLQLQWYGVSDNDFMRYRIYAGLSSNPSTVMDSTHAGDKFDTYVVLKGLTNGLQYYVRITAVDSTGNESSFSNEVSGIPSLFTELKELNPDSNTVVLLHMNESTLGLVEDASGWNNHGTAFSGSSVNPSGRFGWGRSYDGSGSATVDIPASPSVTFGAGDFTAEMFFKTSNTDATQRLFFRFNGSSNKSWTVNLGFGAPLGVLNFEGLGTPSINGSTLLNDGRWHHIAAVRNGNTVHLYADGRLEGSGPVIMPDTAGGSLFVGGNNFNPTGMMDEVRVSNIARNPFSFNLQLAPVNLAATAAGTNVNLTWANGGGLAPLRRYYIYRGTDSTSMTAIDSTVNLNYSDAGLASSTEYFYRITAKDSSGFEGARSFAAAAVTADMDPPAIPQNLLSAAGDGAVTLHWNPNTESDLAKYYIYAGTAIYPTTIVDSTCGGLNDTLKTITGLTNDQQYYFRVTAVDTNGNISGYSDQIGAMPKDITPPAVPAGFYALVNNGLITLKWKQNHEPDLKKYRIYYHPNLGTIVPLDSTVTGADTSKSFGGFAYG
ncbi:MAG: fibronectin type III domain-containing protein, partial [Bacteroidota bacterium]